MVAIVTSFPRKRSPSPIYINLEWDLRLDFSLPGSRLYHPWSWALMAELCWGAGQGCRHLRVCEEIHIPEFRISETLKLPSSSSFLSGLLGTLVAMVMD